MSQEVLMNLFRNMSSGIITLLKLLPNLPGDSGLTSQLQLRESSPKSLLQAGVYCTSIEAH